MPTPIVTPADPNASAPSVSWIPGRKIGTGGISGVLAMFVLAAVSAWLHVDAGTYLQPYVDLVANATTLVGLPPIQPAPSAQTLLTLMIAYGISWTIPAKAQSIINRVTDQIIAAAIRDPKSPVTAASVAAVAAKANVAPKANTK